MATENAHTLKLRAIQPTRHLFTSDSIQALPQGKVLEFPDGTKYVMWNYALRRIAT